MGTAADGGIPAGGRPAGTAPGTAGRSIDCMIALAISSSLTSPLVNSSTAEPRFSASSRRSPSMSGFVWVFGATKDAPSSTNSPEAFMRRANTRIPARRTRTSAPLAAGGRMLNNPLEPVASSTLASRSRVDTAPVEAVRLSMNVAPPRATSSEGVRVTTTSMVAPTANSLIVDGFTTSVQSERFSLSLSNKTAVMSAVSGVLPSLRTTKVSLCPSSLEMPCKIPSPDL